MHLEDVGVLQQQKRNKSTYSGQLNNQSNKRLWVDYKCLNVLYIHFSSRWLQVLAH